MEAAAPPASQARLDRLGRIWKETPGVLGWITTTDHKRIGILYFFTAIAFFLAGGVEALLIRTQLIGPNGTVLSPETFNQVMTMHGVTMIFLFVIPMSTGAFGNYLLPLMIGARDMAFPRLNALSFWIYLCSGIFMYVGLMSGNGPNAGWFDYVPARLEDLQPRPGDRLLRARPDLQRDLDPGGGDQLHRHDLQAAGAGDVDQPDAALLLRLPRRLLRPRLRPAAAEHGAVPARARPPARLPLLRRRLRRRNDPLAEPVLDLRPPRGLHHHPARLRDRDLDHPHLRAKTDGRLPARRPGRDPRRPARLRGLGAPHVRRRPLDRDHRLLRRRQPDHRHPQRRSSSSPGSRRSSPARRASRRRCCGSSASSSSSSSAASPG